MAETKESIVNIPETEEPKRFNFFKKVSSWFGGAISNQFLVLSLIVVFIGMFLRVWQLSVPGGFSIEEVAYLKPALLTIRSGFHLSQLPASGPLFTLMLAGLLKATSGSVLLTRAFFVFLGFLSIACFYLLTSNWFNKQVSLLATLFFSLNAEAIIYSRIVNPVVLVILLQLLVIFLLTQAFRYKNVILFILSGITATLGIFVDPSFVVTGAVLTLASLSVLILKPKIFKVYAWEIVALVLPIILGLGTYLMIYLVKLLPLVNTFIPESFAKYYLNIGEIVLNIFYSGQLSSSFTVSYEPILDPLVAITAICGIFFVIFHFDKRKHRFILLWATGLLFVGALSASLSLDNIIPILIPVLILSALALDYLLTSWVRTFPFDRAARILMTVAFSIFLFLSVYYNYLKYYDGWLNNKTISEHYVYKIHNNKVTK